MKMRFAMAVLAAGVLSSVSLAQVVYEPVRYQYGRYNEVFYGGTNPSLASDHYVYLPPALQAAYAARRMNTPLGIYQYMPYGPGSPFFSPYPVDPSNSAAVYTPYVFTDLLPYEEAGQFGFTPDDARNEAYGNVPLYQSGSGPAPGKAAGPATQPATQPAASAAPHIAPRDKAIPLLDWAKVERTRNPALYKALMDEARKLDPGMTDAMEKSMATER